MPLPEPTVPPPHTQVPSQSLQAAGSPGPGTGFVPPETGPCCSPCSRSCSRPGADPPSSGAPVLLSLPQTPVSIWQTATPPPPAPSAFQGPILAFLCNSGHPKTKPAICNNQRKVSSCCCLGALRPLLSSVLPSSVGVLHLTPWTRERT